VFAVTDEPSPRSSSTFLHGWRDRHDRPHHEPGRIGNLSFDCGNKVFGAGADEM